MIDAIKSQIRDFHEREFPEGLIDRNLSVPLDSNKVVSIVGPRRAGKTCYLYTLIRKLDSIVGRERIVYINFEDERLNLDTTGLQMIIDAYEQMYPSMRVKDVYFFLDEIQEIQGWEKFVRRLSDTISRHIFLTGSSSKLLGGGIASALRGRTLTYNLMPFSFVEHLRYFNIDPRNRHSTRNKNRIVAEFDRFLNRGGYPEVLEYDEELFIRTLQSYVDIMLYRDIIDRHGIRQGHLVKDMARRFIADHTQLFSVHKCYRDFKSRGIQIGKDKLYQYFDHFCDACYIIPLRKYDRSITKQEQALKKVYLNDTGYVKAFTYSASRDDRRLLEATVFLEFIKQGVDMCYFSDRGECDFVLKEGSKVTAAVQVCHELNASNRSREIRGLQNAMEYFGLKDGFIVTRNQEECLDTDKERINVVSGWKWILERTA